MAIPDKQVPAVHHRRIGDITVTAISDGYLDGSMRSSRTSRRRRRARILRDSFRPARRTSVNAFLIHSAGGWRWSTPARGTACCRPAGKLLANMAAAGIDPAEIDTVLLTHMHPDHSAGLAD